MADKMLIDASHEEETRVVVVRGNRIEEFDFESQHKKQLRGNIYLAKVTRVEPSLQAAFVDYGGNRHGFLAFSEIHPDYYQIPLADREALLKEASEEDDGDDAEASITEPAEASEKAAEADGKPKPRTRRGRAKSRSNKADSKADEATQEPEKAAGAEASAEAADASEAKAKTEAKSDDASEAAATAETTEATEETAKPKPRRRRKPAAKKAAKGEAEAAPEGGDNTASEDQASGENGSDDENKGGPTHMAAEVDADTISEDVDDDDDSVESVGAEDAMEEVPDNGHRRMRKQYRIQEVIKRRQILLVQVAKEERGNKGAALTTYLSLAGRYSVLMPNTARGGGISRKITNPADRKRLKEVAKGLEVPQGMGVILRTAGANRTKAEVKRDFEYLMRLWENVRSKTLTSTAPCLVYEEGSLIKRSIRDLYNKDISEVIVSGDEGYREAKDFMKMLMPSHAKVVQRYRDIHPIYSRSGIEAQLDRMLQPQVTLKSGGYLIINQTEALVAIDVNSGRSTREHSIEDTALQTNLEAAEEVARQLRLRDLAGLVVIDFIDMEEKRNNRAVEKKLKECLKNDRARIQVGRISHFGLLEMSRQRIRASVLESTTQVCSHCGGTGHVLSQSSVALHVLRGVEEYLLKNTTHNITVRTTPEIAPYLLNQKRNTIVDYENRFGVEIIVEADGDLENSHFEIDRRDPVENPVKIEALFNFIDEPEEDVAEIPDADEADETDNAPASGNANGSNASDSNGDDEGGRSRRKRRRRRGGRNGGQQNGSSAESEQSQDDDDSGSPDDNAQDASNSGDDDDKPRRKRRRGKRGGRRNRSEDDAQQETSGDTDEAKGEDNASETVAEKQPQETATADASEAPQESAAEAPENAAGETVTEKPAEEAAETSVEQPSETTEDEAMAEIEGRKPRRRRKPKAEKTEAVAEETLAEAAEAKPETDETPAAKEEQPSAEEASTADAEAEPEATETPADDEKAETKRANRGANIASSEPVVTSNGAENDDEPAKPKRGWWQRRGFF
ncbi:Rne/Rng family ribonuclease [Martelella lutilitoris]|uniref:Ribonuclease E n=1 Tax=Martelella lutilitoris TaxID=2583532 RepID=A0A7T7KMJ9_9HYPH|nr:ribonuclease E/G [Martelella lutilitoris]QQM31835.1 Rne/Rng family ribonuclease [Martelella lutilitoris]